MDEPRNNIGRELRRATRARIALLSVLVGCTFLVLGEKSDGQEASHDTEPELVKHQTQITSLRGSTQMIRWVEPLDWKADPNVERPLVVFLHSWSADYRQIRPELEWLVARKGWWLLAPDFQGANRRPEACGSPQAQTDILDAVRWACENLTVDRTRIYLTGVSGGGHMTLLMVGRYPKVWAGASAWVGISDLGRWHQEHVGRTEYAANLEAVCGGAWGESPTIDRQYMVRSPLAYLHHAHAVPLDIAAGVRDGHRGSVPIHHSIDAFRKVVQGAPDDAEESLIAPELQQRLEASPDLLPDPVGRDEIWEREIYLRIERGATRLSLFDGGHEGIDAGVIEFLERQRRAEPVDLQELEQPGTEPDLSWWDQRSEREEGLPR